MGRTRGLVAAWLAVLAVLGCAQAAAAAAPASRFNGPGQGHYDVCVKLESPIAALRFGNGDPTGFALDRMLSFEHGRCGFGRVRIDLHEVIPSSRGPLVFHRGGHGYDDAQNVKYGELLRSDLSTQLPKPLPSGGGRGSACELAAERPFALRVRSIPRLMKYKRPWETDSGSNSGASFLHYGDPGADQGDRTDIHYTYLSWSWVNVQGGGMVRTLLPDGQVVRLCDVEPIVMRSWDKQGRHNGYVAAHYVRTTVGRCRLHGWVAWAHWYLGDAVPQWNHHAERAATPPPADPQPSESCPKAPAARRPSVALGAVTLNKDGRLKLRGRINPQGVPARYRFELGVGRRFETKTELHETRSDERVHEVAGYARGLRPGTVYRYRLVATSVHGVSRSGDRTVRTPGRWLPPPPPPARTRTVTLSDLTIAPRRFRRTRSPRRSRARIGFKLSDPARVTLMFHRRARSGRWRRVRPSMRAVRAAGVTVVRFGGWTAPKRRLPRGRYVLTAVPRVAAGRGTARRTSFRLR